MGEGGGGDGGGGITAGDDVKESLCSGHFDFREIEECQIPLQLRPFFMIIIISIIIIIVIIFCY